MFSNLLVLCSFIIIGFVLTKLKDIKLKDFANLLLYVLTPVIIFFGTYKAELDSSIIYAPFLTFLVCFILAFSSLFILSYFIRDKRKYILSYLAGSVNGGYFGLPIAISVLDEQTLSLYILALLGANIFEMTFGIYICARGEYSVKDSIKKIFSLPLLYMAVLGLTLNYNNVSLLEEIKSIEVYFKHTYTFLGMLVIGIGLGNIKSFKLDWFYLIFSIVIKYVGWLLVVLAIIAVDKYIIDLYDDALYNILLLFAIMPVAANLVLFSSFFGYEEEKASLSLLVTTIIAIFYIPFMIKLLF